MLGLSPQQPPPPSPAPGGDSAVPDEMLSALSRLMPLFSQAGKDDDATRLLDALRPFLREEKIRKLESARKMLRLMKLLPALKDGGMLDFF